MAGQTVQGARAARSRKGRFCQMWRGCFCAFARRATRDTGGKGSKGRGHVSGPPVDGARCAFATLASRPYLIRQRMVSPKCGLKNTAVHPTKLRPILVPWRTSSMLDWITVATSGRPNGPRAKSGEKQRDAILPSVARSKGARVAKGMTGVAPCSSCLQTRGRHGLDPVVSSCQDT